MSLFWSMVRTAVKDAPSLPGSQLAVIYVPALQPVFHTQALPGAALALCLGLSLLVPAAVEVEKWAIRRGWLYAPSSSAAEGA